MDRNPKANPLRGVPYLLEDCRPSQVRFVLLRFKESPGLPSWLEMYSPKFYLKSESGRGSSKRLPLPHPYEPGYRLCTFEVAAHTNIDGLQIPVDFFFKAYIRKASGATNADDLILKAHLRCVATNVSAAIESGGLIPTLAHPYLAWDGRFYESLRDSFSYTVTNSVLLSKTDPVVVQALRRKIAELEARDRTKPLVQRIAETFEAMWSKFGSTDE